MFSSMVTKLSDDDLPNGYSVEIASDNETWAWRKDAEDICSWELDNGVFDSKEEAIKAAWSDFNTYSSQ